MSAGISNVYYVEWRRHAYVESIGDSLTQSLRWLGGLPGAMVEQLHGNSWYTTAVTLVIAYDYCAASEDINLEVIVWSCVHLCVAHLFTNVN